MIRSAMALLALAVWAPTFGAEFSYSFLSAQYTYKSFDSGDPPKAGLGASGSFAVNDHFFIAGSIEKSYLEEKAVSSVTSHWIAGFDVGEPTITEALIGVGLNFSPVENVSVFLLGGQTRSEIVVPLARSDESAGWIERSHDGHHGRVGMRVLLTPEWEVGLSVTGQKVDGTNSELIAVEVKRRFSRRREVSLGFVRRKENDAYSTHIQLNATWHMGVNR